MTLISLIVDYHFLCSGHWVLLWGFVDVGKVDEASWSIWSAEQSNDLLDPVVWHLPHSEKGKDLSEVKNDVAHQVADVMEDEVNNPVTEASVVEFHL